jgi:hypothetical protein
MSRVPRPDVIATDAGTTITGPRWQDAWEGIGRIVALGNDLLVNNLYRNFELWRLDAGGRDVQRRWRFCDAIFPGEDDVHCAHVTADGRHLIEVNHYGRVHCFALPLPNASSELQPVAELRFRGDVERIVFSHDCLIGTSPRGYSANDAPEPGIVISEAVSTLIVTAPEAQIALRSDLTSWGVISALAVLEEPHALAVAAGTRLALFALQADEGGLRLGEWLWQKTLPFYMQWLRFEADGRLLAAGYTGESEDTRTDGWSSARGGGLIAFALEGRRLVDLPLPDATAWGYGGAPLALSADGCSVFVLDRTAGLHALDLRSGQPSQLYDGIEVPEDAASLGIGHCGVVGDYLYGGFSRGGYRLFRYGLSSYTGARGSG